MFIFLKKKKIQYVIYTISLFCYLEIPNHPKDKQINIYVFIQKMGRKIKDKSVLWLSLNFLLLKIENTAKLC